MRQAVRKASQSRSGKELLLGPMPEGVSSKKPSQEDGDSKEGVSPCAKEV